MSSCTFIEMIVSKKCFDIINTLYFFLDNVMFWEAYRWERLDLGHIYIQKFPEDKMYAGQTTNLKRRMKNYRSLMGSNKHHTSALKKHLDTMQISIARCPKYLLDAVEIFVIAFFDLTDPSKGYNKQSGGRKGCRMSKEVRMRISIANIGRTITEAHRAKISIANIGKTLTEEHRAKISIANIGKTHTEESRAKMSKNMLGKKRSKEACAKMSEYRKKSTFKPNSKPICVFGKLYGSVKDASDTLRDVCDTIRDDNFMKTWIKHKKHQHNVFYVSKEFYNTMKDTTEIITRDMYERWTSQM
ncbi:GIY-YIG catalytic domain-containing endonuclease [Acanthocystis turfacea Chlorella virus TN603.4.2]|nr:GIY-YIG catalytic domain-containing endonuclease [Acanthocystis turfacea Chlorella virus TN603.4.2]